jgi:hypothetical protein
VLKADSQHSLHDEITPKPDFNSQLVVSHAVEANLTRSNVDAVNKLRIMTSMTTIL